MHQWIFKHLSVRAWCNCCHRVILRYVLQLNVPCDVMHFSNHDDVSTATLVQAFFQHKRYCCLFQVAIFSLSLVYMHLCWLQSPISSVCFILHPHKMLAGCTLASSHGENGYCCKACAALRCGSSMLCFFIDCAGG
jgi:hypothetical protein